MIKKTTVIHNGRDLLKGVPTIHVPVPEYLYLATANARCAKIDCYIQPGDHVNLGQKIGLRYGGFFEQPIHATCSGTFVGFEKHYHRSGKLVDYFKIQNDFKDTVDPSIRDRSDEEIAALSRTDMVEILKETASVGLGGSSFPTYVKFNTDRKINTILLNGIECEPYLSSDHRLLLEDHEEMIQGIKYIMQAFDCHDARICVKSKYKDLITVYEQGILPRYENSGITLCKVGNFYPQGWEVAMIKSATGIEVETGHLPSEYGIVNFNVTTAYGIAMAIKHNMPVYERYMSIVGDGIKHPCNCKVRIGTPIKSLIEMAGGYKDPDIPKVLILGGPMMGASELNDDCIATKTVTSIIVLNERKYVEEPCVRCGSCVYSCPTGLEPITIRSAMKSMPVDKQKIKFLNPLKCIECGLCTYSCPSKIPLLEAVRRAKVVAKLK